MSKEQINRYVMLIFGLLCLVLLILTSLSLIPVSQWLGQDEIIAFINSYLNESQKVERQELIVLLELESLLSPMQHANAGVSFIVDIQVGIGDMLTSFNKLILDTIDIYIFTISTIEVIRYIIVISETITPWLFTALLLTGTAFGLCHSFSDSYGAHIALCNQTMKIVVVLFFVLHILLPYSFFTAAIFSKDIIRKDRVENRAIIHNLYSDINATHKKEELSTRADNYMHLFEKTILNLPHKIELMAIHHTKHMAMSIFEFIILPVLLFLTSIGVLRWMIKIKITSS